jgi:hypothetical protein
VRASIATKRTPESLNINLWIDILRDFGVKKRDLLIIGRSLMFGLLLAGNVALGAPQYSFFVWYPRGSNGGAPYTRHAPEVWSKINSELLEYFPSKGTVTRHWNIISLRSLGDSMQYNIDASEFAWTPYDTFGACRGGGSYFDVLEESIADLNAAAAPGCVNFTFQSSIISFVDAGIFWVPGTHTADICTVDSSGACSSPYQHYEQTIITAGKVIRAAGHITVPVPRNLDTCGASSKGNSSQPSGLLIGNPIHVATGDKAERTVDYAMVASDPLELVRVSHSQGAAFFAPLMGWTTTFTRFLLPSPVDAPVPELHFVRPDGGVLSFGGSGMTWAPKYADSSALLTPRFSSVGTQSG